MKVGLLGAGRIGALHAGVLAGDPGVDELLVGDADMRRAEEVAREVGGEAGRIEAVLDSGPDAVVIAASTPAHAPLIRATVEAGIPAFCEKPIALGYGETVEVVRWLTGGDVEEVYATGSVRNFDFFSEHGDVDTSAALIRMKDGVVAVLTGGRHDPLGYDVRAEVFGSKDSVAVGVDRRTPLRSVEPGIPASEKGAYPNFQERFLEAYTAEMQHFLSLVRGEAGNPCTATDALEALRIALAADLSLAEQ